MFVHGWQSSEKNYAHRAEPLSSLGFTCLTFSLRGHGDSEGQVGNARVEDHIRDVCRAHDFLTSQSSVNPDEVHVVGVSFGGYLSSVLTGNKSVTSLVLRAPVMLMDQHVSVQGKDLRVEDALAYGNSPLEKPDNMAARALSSFSGRVLLIDSENDSIVTPTTIRNYERVLRRDRMERRTIVQADHWLSDASSREVFVGLLVDWFSRFNQNQVAAK